MKTSTRPALLALVSTLSLSAVACDQPADDPSLRFAPEEVAAMIADNGFRAEADELLAAIEAGEDIPDAEPASAEGSALDLELADDAEPVASFPTRSECFAAYCFNPQPGLVWSGQCSYGNVIYPGACILMPEIDYALPGCSVFSYEATFCSQVQPF